MTNQTQVAPATENPDLPSPVNTGDAVTSATQQMIDAAMAMKATQIQHSISLYQNNETPYLDALGYETIEGMMNALDGIQGETGVDREVLERVVMLGFNSGVKVSQALCEQLKR